MGRGAAARAVIQGGDSAPTRGVATPGFLVEGYFPPEAYENLLRNERRDAEKSFDRLLGSVEGSGLTIRIRLEVGGRRPRASSRLRSRKAADLLVVGTHSRTGLPRAILGSIADRMVRQATCPVLTVRPIPERAPRHEIRRICYATDFSPTARAAWPWVVAIATAAGAEVDLVHVFEPVADRHLPAEAIGRMAQFLRDQGRSKSNGSSSGRRCRVSASTCASPRGFRGSRSSIRPRPSDLIVMGTHGWSGVVRWMLGSVAHYVIQTAPLPCAHDRAGQSLGAGESGCGVARSRAVKPLPHHYTVRLTGGPSGYVIVTADGPPELRSAPPLDFDGPGDAWSPEHLLLRWWSRRCSCSPCAPWRGLRGSSSRHAR